MEGLFRLLLVAGLLAAVLPAAAATFGPQPGDPCKPTLLATQVSLFCAPDMPTAQCCEPVVAAVDLGGGVPCLCRVAAEPQLIMAGLNARHLLTLYTSCVPEVPGGAHLAAPCEGPAPPAAVVSTPPAAVSSRPRPKHPAEPRSTEYRQHDGLQMDTATRFSLLKANSCAAAVALSASVAVECGSHLSEDACCSVLRKAVQPEKKLACLCTLAESDAVNEAGVTVRDLVDVYSSCNSIRPGDLHLPSGGCAAADVESMATPPASSRPETRSAPPPAGRLPAATAGRSASAPTAARAPTSSDHPLLVAIFVTLVCIAIVSTVATVGYVAKRVHFGWTRMRHVEEQRQDRAPQPNTVIVLNNGHYIRDPPPAASDSASAVGEINSAVNEIVLQAEILRRYSPRLAGEEPANPGLQ